MSLNIAGNPEQRKFRADLLKWSLIGLGLRLFLMFFTMHGQDICFMNYFPMIFVKRGIWDPYGFVGTNFPYFDLAYYGPVVYIIMSVYNFLLLTIFNPASYIKILDASVLMYFNGFSPVDYVHAFSGMDLFRNLFLMKLPYLVFDFLTGVILLKFSIPDKHKLLCYKLWMLNIVVLHSVYAIGQCDIFTAFFIVAALYSGVNKRAYACIVLLAFGGAAKLFAYFLILPACLLLTQSWKKRSLLLLVAGAVSGLLYLPFYLSSGGDFIKFFFSVPLIKTYSGPVKYALMAAFLIFYFLILLKSLKESGGIEPEKKLLFYFLTIGFLIYTLTPIGFRYLVPVTPLLALLFPENRKFGIFILLVIFIVAFLRLAERDLQFGLFAPLDPGFFMGLPTIQEVVGKFMNINLIYRALSRFLVVCFFGAAWWSWRMRRAEQQ